MSSTQRPSSRFSLSDYLLCSLSESLSLSFFRQHQQPLLPLAGNRSATTSSPSRSPSPESQSHQAAAASPASRRAGLRFLFVEQGLARSSTPPLASSSVVRRGRGARRGRPHAAPAPRQAAGVPSPCALSAAPPSPSCHCPLHLFARSPLLAVDRAGVLSAAVPATCSVDSSPHRPAPLSSSRTAPSAVELCFPCASSLLFVQIEQQQVDARVDCASPASDRQVGSKARLRPPAGLPCQIAWPSAPPRLASLLHQRAEAHG